MNVVGAIFLVICFFILLDKLGVIENSKKVTTISKNALRDVQDNSMDDLSKENAMKGYAKKLLLLLIYLLMTGAAALFIPIGIIYVFAHFRLLSFDNVVQTTLKWQFIAASTIFGLLYYTIFKKNRASSSHASYSAVEKLLHYVAFNTFHAQVGLSDIEDTIYRKQLISIKIYKPVFITALPRAGTTILLETLTHNKEFGSHRYCDMPFVLIPLLWNGISKSHRKKEILKERAHGDGILINPDSPEAFEEMVWKIFWKKQYLNDRILPWKNKNNIEFVEYFRSHIKKVILLRKELEKNTERYISKNNLNICRIPILKRIFNDSIILVPFRQPIQHAYSLLRQHKNFLNLHERDKFACKYMEAIGHYDFGSNLRPIDFEEMLDTSKHKNTNTIEFWIEYWCMAYKYLLEKIPKLDIVFISFERLCEFPFESLTKIAKIVEFKQNDEAYIKGMSSKLKNNKPYEINTNLIDKELLNNANNIYDELLNRSCI